MRQIICKNQEQQISIQNILVNKNNVIDMEMCANFEIFVLQRLVTLITRLTD